MLRIRRADARGTTRLEWLDSRHGFSFGGYRDPEHMGFGALRVLNEDRVAPGAGFEPHPHRDMEILSIVLEGALEHRDDGGHHGVLRPGDVQRMRAGRGVWHSEWNASPERPVHFLQVWIVPAERGLEPGYAQARVPLAGEPGRWLPVAAGPEAGEAPLDVRQDVRVHALRLEAGKTIACDLEPGRRAWLQVARGALRAGDAALRAGDGLAVEGEPRLVLEADEPSEVWRFDLA